MTAAAPGSSAPGAGLVFAAGSVEDCARALADALKLAGDPATEAACRARAMEFDWSVRVEAYESLYQRAASLRSG